MKRHLPFALTMMLALAARAEVVHVSTDVNGQVTTTSVETLSAFTTPSAPAVSGKVFTGWTISTGESLVSRDAMGRALEAVTATIYQDTTLTANYLPASQDGDGDGIADGWELYWYGDLDEGAESDTDGDGFHFGAEIALGMNPLLADEAGAGAEIITATGGFVQYNVETTYRWVVRSEPEGTLFATYSSDIAHPGDVVTTAAYTPATSRFAYWTVDGVAQRDATGRALDGVAVRVANHDVEIVAVCVDDANARQARYWYADETALDSDTDGDGFRFGAEIALGMNPLLADEAGAGAEILTATGGFVQYNVETTYRWVVRSEPEGTLFATYSSDVAHPGDVVATAAYSPATSRFAYWTVDGVAQRDATGRALDSVAVRVANHDVEIVAVCVNDANARQARYWYADETALDSDTDGDGFRLGAEIALGMNPLLADEAGAGAEIVTATGPWQEVNLQVYEQGLGVVVDGQYATLFASPVAGAEGRTFAGGSQIWPVVADVNGDGLWDMIVVSERETNVFVNVGVRGFPKFEEEEVEERGGGGRWKNIDLLMNSTAKLAGMALDVEPVGALSATTNGATMLVSDEDGRIWLYESANCQLPTTSYQLLHKVWGGSYAGFANGLMLAAVDWDDDGDLDCLCGTAEGKLMLLADPEVGRPANLRALAGVDSVLLTWQPNGQSRVRGYRLYRADEVKVGGEGEQWNVLDYPSLPKYRDAGLEAGTYGYKVSALSRFYTAGNSTPTETESAASEPVTAAVGGATFTWGESAKRVDGLVEVVLSINNSLNYDAKGKKFTATYDPAKLRPFKVEKTGLTETLAIADSDDGKGGWSVTVASGTVAAGGGKFLVFVYEDLGLPPTVLMGDLDGDGDADDEDLRLLATFKNGARKYTDYQLRAGDFNHNGKLDNADYQALKDIVKGK